MIPKPPPCLTGQEAPQNIMCNIVWGAQYINILSNRPHSLSSSPGCTLVHSPPTPTCGPLHQTLWLVSPLSTLPWMADQEKRTKKTTLCIVGLALGQFLYLPNLFLLPVGTLGVRNFLSLFPGSSLVPVPSRADRKDRTLLLEGLEGRLNLA